MKGQTQTPIQPVYRNGDWCVVPVISHLRVIGRGGICVGPSLPVDAVEQAVELADELAYRDGVRDHVAA